MEINSILRRVKICAESNEKNYELKGDDNSLLCITPHDDIQFDVLLKTGGLPVASELICRVSLEIFDIGSLNAPSPRSEKLLLSKIQPPNSNIGADGEVISHASFALSADDTSISEGRKWLKICAFDSAGRRSTFAQGWILVARGVGDGEIEDASSREIYAKKSEVEEFFMKKCDNLAHLENFSSSRSNLGVYSKNEVHSIVSRHSLKSANLSDLESIESARENLNVYSKLESDASSRQKIEESAEKIIRIASQTAKANSALYVRRGRFQSAAGSFDTSAIKNVSIAIDFEIESLENKSEDAPYALCLFSNVYRNGGLYLTILVSPDGSGKRLMYFGATYEAVAGTYSNKTYALSENQLLGRHTLAICSGEHVPVGTGGYMDYRMFLDGAELPLTIGNQGFYFNETTANAGYFYFGGHSASHSTLVPSRFKTCPWDMKLHRYKIFNYDIFSAGVPYSHDDFLSGKLVPPSLRNSANAQRILWEMADFTYPENSSTRLILDESGNGGNATITGDIAGDKDGASDVFISKLKEQISQLG